MFVYLKDFSTQIKFGTQFSIQNHILTISKHIFHSAFNRSSASEFVRVSITFPLINKVSSSHTFPLINKVSSSHTRHNHLP